MSKYIDLELALNELLRLYEEDCDRYGVEIPECFDYGRARETLQSLPTIEVSEDCISREDAVNALISHFVPQTYTGEEVEQASKLARKIMANVPSVVPTTEQSSMVGEWKKEYNGNGWNDYWDYTCSVCGKKFERAEPYPFCPNCGAKMKG